MSRNVFFTIFVLFGLLLASACNTINTPEPVNNADMPNPASAFCELNDGTLEIRTDGSGGQYGVCFFSDGSECDEWAFYRGECKPGDNLKPVDSAEDLTPSANMPNPASVFCDQNGGVLEIRTDINGSQSGICIFSDASECDEWAFFRGECKVGDSLSPLNMNNPASAYCEANTGRLEIRADANGGQVGYCIFWDGSECEEWSYYRGECREGESLMKSTTTPPAPETAPDGCQIFRNEALGYSFHYPANVTISTGVNYDNTVSITGPLVDNNNWPMILFNHIQQRLDYSPPEDADLEQWLQDNNLLVEERMADTQIAGTTAIHLRHARSPQSYASDTFFFAHNGQLYSVVFLHTGDKEDWDLYNHFLENIQFEK